MTILEAQKALAKDLKIIFKDYKLKDENDEPHSISVYEDMLPKPKTDDDSTVPFPYIIVRADSGKYVEESDDSNIGKFLILIGVCDYDEKYPANRDVLMVIQRIIERYSKNYILDNKFRRIGDIEWTISDEDTFPYCFGGIEINFTIPKITKEDDYC